jgi:hypothetical protein
VKNQRRARASEPAKIAARGVRVGRATGFAPDGRVLVRCHESAEPVPARIVSGVSREMLDRAIVSNGELLLAFEGDDPSRPFVLGVIDEPAPSSIAEPSALVRRDGERLVIEAEGEIELRCGGSSIVLRKDGRVAIEGRDVHTRAKRRNRIRGGSVAIN